MNIFNKLKKWIKMKFTLDENKEGELSNNVEYKVLILGEKGVGKSSICNRFVYNEFNLEIKPTLQSECYTKSIKLLEHNISLYIVDIDEYVMSNDRSNLYQDVKGALIVYDITKNKSFEKLDNWVLDIRQNTSLNIPLLICGNKTDLNFLRNVDYEEGIEKANSLGCEFIEISCVDITSVKEAFKLLIAKIFFAELPESKRNYFKIYFSTKDSEEEIKKPLNNDLKKEDFIDK
jgi:Ras-related protein Rab-11A